MPGPVMCSTWAIVSGCIPSGPDGDLGFGASGAFDDQQRSYDSAIKRGNTYHLWYTGNHFGATDMGYCRLSG